MAKRRLRHLTVEISDWKSDSLFEARPRLRVNPWPREPDNLFPIYIYTHFPTYKPSDGSTGQGQTSIDSERQDICARIALQSVHNIFLASTFIQIQRGDPLVLDY